MGKDNLSVPGRDGILSVGWLVIITKWPGTDLIAVLLEELKTESPAPVVSSGVILMLRFFCFAKHR